MDETSLYFPMKTQAQLLIDQVEYIFEQIGNSVNDLSEDELRWKPCQGSNTINWILTHMARIAYVLIPQVLRGTVKPDGWDDDYEELHHSQDELLDDLNKAQTIIREELSKTSDDELATTLTIWDKKTVRKNLLFHLLAELIHHNGQIAMLRGIYKRSGRSD